jgi:hypothetical protein
MRRVLLLAGLTLACIPAAFASATATHHSSSVTIALDSGPPANFFGFVHSRQPRCFKARTVKLLIGPSGSQEVVGQDVTKGDGSWEVSVESNFRAGDYQAKAVRKVFQRHGRRHVCDAAKSRILTEN